MTAQGYKFNLLELYMLVTRVFFILRTSCVSLLRTLIDKLRHASGAR